MDTLDLIKRNAEKLLKQIPENVTLLAAAKTRSNEEVQAAFDAGIRCFGHNYVQEAQAMLPGLPFRADWHMIGHLQRNKAGAAVELFDVLETLDSARLARELEKQCARLNKIMPVLIEINSGREENKDGVLPEDVDALAEALREFPHLKLSGFMTMGPLTGDPELSRPYFQTTARIYEQYRLKDDAIRFLSMGMSHSYKAAIEEGANLVRIGTLLFGPRN
ncbi:MAG: YggS family pyridoxal phosphate-dependent enzyme [Anaerolineae bacterium]|nr:YggS family pyridoxal phosphate-dependent enzyme [Anaerolineae bacterium]